MTSRFAVGSVSTLAMGALLFGSALFWLNRPGAAGRTTPWGDLASLSPGSAAAAQSDEKTQLLKLAAMKSGADTPAPAPSATPTTPPDVPSVVPSPAETAPAAAQAADPAPAAVAAPVQIASAEETTASAAAMPARDDTALKAGTIDLNTASVDALDHLGAGHVGRSIVSHRPYRSVKDLVGKRVLRTSDYQKVESRVRVD